MNEHLAYNFHPSGTFPTFTNPTGVNSIPVESFNVDGVRTLEIPEDTGATIRSRAYTYQGGVNASGSLSMKGYPTGLVPLLFRSFLTNVDANLAGTAYDNDLLPDDPGSITNPQFPWFSFVQYYAGVAGKAVRGAVPTKITLSCTGGEALMVAVDLLAADTGLSGGVWSDVPTVAVPSLPTIAYPTTLPPPLRFHEGGIYLGGNISLSTNKMTTSQATPLAVIDTFTLEITLNVEGRFPIRPGAPTIGYTRHGIRNITFSGDYDWADYTTANYTNARNAAESALQLRFISDTDIPGQTNQRYELIISLPRMIWPNDGGLLPPVTGGITPRKQSISLTALQDIGAGNTGYDIGVSIQTEADLT